MSSDQTQNERSLKPRWAMLALVSVLVLVFRTAAWLNPSSFIVIPAPLALPIAGLGVLFLACGVWVWASGPSTLTRVFLLHGIGGAVHWGGTIGAEHSGVAIALLVFYLAATAMGDAAFLDLGLRFPRPLFRRGLPTWIIYAVAMLTLLAVPIAPLLPTATVESGIGIVFLLTLIMSIAGGIAFVVQWFRATPAVRNQSLLTLIIAVLILTTAIDMVADTGMLPGNPEAWNLTYGLVPLVLAWAIIRSGPPKVLGPHACS